LNLRARRQRPRRRRAAEQRDELAPFHSISLASNTKGIAHLSTAALRDFNPS